MKAAVEAAFAEALAEAAHRVPPGRLRAIRRSENETLLRQVVTYLARAPAAGAPETYVVPLSCECGRSGCELQPSLTVAGYERLLTGGGFLDGH
jgi:hypothetical protein